MLLNSNREIEQSLQQQDNNLETYHPKILDSISSVNLNLSRRFVLFLLRISRDTSKLARRADNRQRRSTVYTCVTNWFPQ